jgi:hypothetical protein
MGGLYAGFASRQWDITLFIIYESMSCKYGIMLPHAFSIHSPLPDGATGAQAEIISRMQQKRLARLGPHPYLPPHLIGTDPNFGCLPGGR